MLKPNLYSVALSLLLAVIAFLAGFYLVAFFLCVIAAIEYGMVEYERR